MQTDSSRVLRRVVFLDRDGTLNVEVNYLSRPEQMQLLPGVGEGLRGLQCAGYALVVLSNQSGLARGYFSESTLAEIHLRMAAQLATHGVELDGIFYCPHRPADNCECRKPKPGLAYRAAKALGLDLNASFVVGDKACDIELGRAIEARTVLVRTGWGGEYDLQVAPAPNFIATNFTEASQWILQNTP